MKQVSYEVATLSFLEIRNGNDDIELVKTVLDYMYQHKPPTWDEVIKVWQDTINDKVEIQRNDEGIRINYPNGIYYLINLEQVYSNRKVFSMNVNATLDAINLTIRYLEAQKHHDL